MEIRELQSVITVSIEKSYEEAADRSSYSFSTIAKHVQRVEEELGVKIFNRAAKGRPLTYTEHGEVIIERLEKLLAEYDKIATYTSSIAPEQKNRITIVSLPLEGSYCENEIFAEFFSSHPEIIVKPKHEDTSDIMKMISEGRAGGGFLILSAPQNRSKSMSRFCEKDDIRIIPLRSQRHPVLACGADHPLGNKKSITLSDLRRETILMNNSHIASESKAEIAFQGRYCYKELEKQDLHKTVRRIDTHVGGGLLEMLRRGDGVFFTTSFFSHALKNIVTIPIEDIFYPTALVFVCSKYNLSPALSKFIETCSRYGDRLYEDIAELEMDRFL